MEITVTGDRVFGDSADPANDFFAQLDEFIGHLRSEDFDAISNTDIQNIQDRLDRVSADPWRDWSQSESVGKKHRTDGVDGY